MQAFQVAADAACSSDGLRTALAEPPLCAGVGSRPITRQTVQIRHYVARRAKLIKDHSRNADEQMPRELGTALITTCTELYFQVDYLLAYGQFGADSGSETYPTRLGFDVLDSEIGISLDARLHLRSVSERTRAWRFFSPSARSRS